MTAAAVTGGTGARAAARTELLARDAASPERRPELPQLVLLSSSFDRWETLCYLEREEKETGTLSQLSSFLSLGSKMSRLLLNTLAVARREKCT